MYNIIPQIRIGWRALGAVPEGKELQSISVKTDFKVNIRAGRLAGDASEIVLFRFRIDSFPGVRNLPHGKGFDVGVYEIEEEKYLGLSRSPTGTVDLFETMLTDVISYVMNSPDESHKLLFKKFIDRVRDWQAFMSKSKNGLSRQEELGLIGEITVLNLLLDQSLASDAVVSWWKGPLHGIHDFMINDGGIEVKATLSEDGFPIEVFDISQLDPVSVEKLYLYGIRFKSDSEGQTLPDLISSTKNRFGFGSASLSAFEHALSYAGYRDEHSNNYTISASLSEILVYDVDETFPSLRRHKLPNEIIDLRYSLDLDLISQPSVSNEDVLIRLGVLEDGIA